MRLLHAHLAASHRGGADTPRVLPKGAVKHCTKSWFAQGCAERKVPAEISTCAAPEPGDSSPNHNHNSSRLLNCPPVPTLRGLRQGYFPCPCMAPPSFLETVCRRLTLQLCTSKNQEPARIDAILRQTPRPNQDRHAEPRVGGRPAQSRLHKYH